MTVVATYIDEYAINTELMFSGCHNYLLTTTLQRNNNNMIIAHRFILVTVQRV